MGKLNWHENWTTRRTADQNGRDRFPRSTWQIKCVYSEEKSMQHTHRGFPPNYLPFLFCCDIRRIQKEREFDARRSEFALTFIQLENDEKEAKLENIRHSMARSRNVQKKYYSEFVFP